MQIKEKNAVFPRKRFIFWHKKDKIYKKIYFSVMAKNERVILGLDISTSCIGACILTDDGEGIPDMKILTHRSPKIPQKLKGIEAMFLRKVIFETEFLSSLRNAGITDVIIEEPLLSSNNVNTIATLLKFNGMVAESVYHTLGVVPNFISSYDARLYSFPELASLRKYNKKGVEYPIKHIREAIKNDSLSLFGSYPFDVDKKKVMMKMVNTLYPDIPWMYNAKGELRKENFDACDSLVCALAFINLNRNGIDKPVIGKSKIETIDKGYLVSYETKIWGETYQKTLEVKF